MNDLDDGTTARRSCGRSRRARRGLLKLDDAASRPRRRRRWAGFLGHIRLLTPRSSYPLGFHHAVRITDSGWRWWAMRPMRSTRSPGRA
jgi:2-octaprenyl-6-methoxyphenol hydroxylase